MLRRLTVIIFAALSILFGGCASITKGTTQAVTVNTDPAGANCTLQRGGKLLAIVNPTPNTITVEKSSGTISMLCKKDGYQDAAGALASEFQPMTFGNIIFGGIIGVAVDAASGAMHLYPPIVTISLIPLQFRSLAERDHFFDKMRASFLVEAEEVEQRIRQQCSGDQCDYEIRAAEAKKQQRLLEIEARRRASPVSQPRPEPEPPPPS